MKEQELLFSIESALDIHPLQNFKVLFDNLKADHLDSTYIKGRKSFPQQGFLKAIIFKNLTGIIGLKATANNVTIAHITVLLVALTAAKSNSKNKIRFVKSFLPNFNF